MTANRFNFKAYFKNQNKIYNVYNLLDNGSTIECIDENGDFISTNDGEIQFDKDFILLQSTDLVDKNGKEIFEGDILKTNLDDNIYIKYSKKLVRFTTILIHPEYKDDDCCGDYVWDEFVGDAKFCEVIGNIYENLELLEDKND